MDVKRVLCATSIAAGLGLAGLVGAATANAAPTPAPRPGPSVKLDHHDRKQVVKQDKKQLKHNPAQVTPASGHR